MGHHGFDVLREGDAAFARSWSQLAGHIPQAELDTLAQTYGHLQGNQEALALEWFARARPKLGITTNMHIDLDYATLAEELPPGVIPAHDGMVIELGL